MGRARAALGSHWPEYLIEAAGLGAFMIVAGICVMLVNAPGTIRAVASPDIRRGVVGIAMGLTAIAIIYSPWGMRSGAHLNPAVTLSFLRLGKMAWRRPMQPSMYWRNLLAGPRVPLRLRRSSVSASPCRRFRPLRHCPAAGARLPHFAQKP